MRFASARRKTAWPADDSRMARPSSAPLSIPTPGAENDPYRVSEVVINEIMYNPISGDSDDEYVELYNRSRRHRRHLAGWRFTDGIDFEFPPERAYRRVATWWSVRDPARMLTNYPGLSPTPGRLGTVRGHT